MTDEDHGQKNAKCWLESIDEMLEALDGHEAAATDAGWTGPHKNKYGATYYQDETDGATWACGSWKELCEAQDIDAEENEDARDTIAESALSVQVRGGWHTPGLEDQPADEYEILLTTGGPALRIWGKLDGYGQPESAELQRQDWGTPWTRYLAPEETLLRFASCFYFGE